MTTTVIFGQAGQIARHVTPEHVTAATYEITAMGQSEGSSTRVLASGAATSTAWLLTLDDDAGPSQPDAPLIPVASTVGPEIGEDAVITAPDGASEPLQVEAIGIGTYIKAGSWLAGAYPSDSTVESLVLTAPIPAAVYDFEDAQKDGRPLRIAWSYTLSSGPRVVTDPILLTRETDAAWQESEAVALLLSGYPDIKGRLLEGLTVDALARYSTAQLRADFDQKSIPHTRLALGNVGVVLLAAKILHEAATRGYAPGQRDLVDFVQEAESRYTRRLDNLAAGGPGLEAQLSSRSGVVDENPDTTYRAPIGAM